MFPKPKPSYVFLLQNGVADHGLHRDSSPLISVGASVDSANGHVASCNSVNRPKELAMSPLKRYSEKRYQRELDRSDDGSLPSTPAELPGGADVPSGAGYEALEAETRQLIGRFLSEFTGLSKAQWSESKELSTMKRVVNDLLVKHRFSFNGKWEFPHIARSHFFFNLLLSRKYLQSGGLFNTNGLCVWDSG